VALIDLVLSNAYSTDIERTFEGEQTIATRRSKKNQSMRCAVTVVSENLPPLSAGFPIWYRGQVAGIAANGEVFSFGWVDGRERRVLRALALAAFEAPHMSADQHFSFAAYCLLPEESWKEVRHLPDELIALSTSLPLEVVRRRRSLPDLGIATPPRLIEAACA
jgi:hypothetical protein